MSALEDIRNVESFSATVVRRSIAKRMTQDEIEEAIAEGVALLYQLHETWDPERCESFYDFCTTYLQFRLISWWRKEARQRGLANRNGGGYTYHHRISLDDYLSEENREPGEAGQRTSRDTDDRALVVHDVHRVGD